jgi:hypothetical protein
MSVKEDCKKNILSHKNYEELKDHEKEELKGEKILVCNLLLLEIT